MSAAPWQAQFLASGDAAPALAARTAEVERIVLAACERWLGPAALRGVALVAVGGFGRRELFPHSDVDLVVLADARLHKTLQEPLAAFLTTLWDAGLRASQTVRTPQECGELHDGNVELSISLLDHRLLAGDRETYGDFLRRVEQLVRARGERLVSALCEMARCRHLRYQQTIHHLEPNVKEAPGGLRDLQLLRWLQKLGGDPAIREWVGEAIEQAHAFMAGLRCFLHLRAGRDDNVLSFEAQEELALQPFSRGESPQAWMRRYYLHARAVHGAALRAVDLCHGRSSSLLRSFRDWRSRLSNAEFTVARGKVWLRNPNLLVQDPASVLRLFAFMARHDLEPSPDTERRVQRALPDIERHFSQPGPHWPALRELLASPYASRALMRMNEIGALGAVLPEWKRIECLPVRDFYHRYTVDEHTLRAVQALERLQRNAEDAAQQRLATLARELAQPEVLRLAVLLHDLGKADSQGGHAERSAVLAGQVAHRIQLPSGERELLSFLVRRHLDLSTALTTRDPADPATRRALAAAVGTTDRLAHLTLLTYADISAVHPTAMSAWWAELLWRLYSAIERELLHEVATELIPAGSSADPERERFLQGLPKRYLLAHSEEEIAGHVELARLCRARGAAVRLARRQGVYEATICAHDRRFLFASLAGVLSAFGMNILRGAAYTNRQGLALDVFIFEDPARTLELNPTERDRLALLLERAAVGRLSVREMLQRRPLPRAPLPGRRVPPRVSFDPTASESAMIIEVFAPDRPGLLFELAHAISESGGSIQTVIVETRAHQAMDVFYVNWEGGKLPAAGIEPVRRALLEAASGQRATRTTL